MMRMRMDLTKEFPVLFIIEALTLAHNPHCASLSGHHDRGRSSEAIIGI